MSYSKQELIQAYKDLRRSRKYIQHNWVAGTYGIERAGTDEATKLGAEDYLDNADRVCSLGALGKAAHVTGDVASNRTSAAFLSCTISKLEPKLDSSYPADNIITFNDTCARGDKSIVLMAWDEAIKTVRGALVGVIRDPDKTQGS